MTTPELEFSYPVAVDGITRGKARTVKISANEKECAALAKRFDVRGLSHLKATLSILRVSGSTTICVSGTFEADVVQACVVSLLDVHGRVEGEFKTYFTEEVKKGREIDFNPEDEEDNAEIIENGMIDLGEVVAQYLLLELDPYPRAPGVSLSAQSAENGIVGKKNPFAVLADMQDGSKKSGK